VREPQAPAPLIDFQIEDIWPILQKQRSVILLFLATVVITTLIGGLLRTKEYRATALIHLTPRPGQEVAVNEVVDFNTRGYFEIQQFYRTQIQIILSRSVREDVVDAYNALGYDDLLPEDDGAGKLYGMMTVIPEEQSQLVDISVVHTDPERAAVLANLIAEVYSKKNLDVRRDASAGATDWLASELQDYEDKVTEANQRLYEFKAASSLVDVEERLTTLEARMDALNNVYGQKTTESVILQTTLASHEELLKTGSWAELSKVLRSPLLDSAARDQAEETAKLADLSSRYGPKHTEVMQSKARLASLEASVRREVERIVDGERAQLTVVDREIASLSGEIDAVKTELLEYQRRTTDYDALKADLTRAEEVYSRLSQRLEEVRLSARTQLNNVQIVDQALVPSSPYKPNIPVSLAVAIIVGIVGGIGLALLREYVDDTITSQHDVNTHLKVPFLGLIPRLPEGISAREADMFTHYNPRGSVAEAIRSLRAMLEMNPNGPAPKRLLVTSSVAREGKTSTTVRLAISFAQMGRKVVVVDADLRRPRVHKVFGTDNTIGLSSYLLGVAGIDDLPQPTPVPNLFTVYSGEQTDHPAELMASTRMEELLTGLEERFDVVLLDTPPSVALSDAVTLSRRVDGIILVVKEQSVSRTVVKQTLDMLHQVDANILGVVLNNVDLQRSGSKYKYYYAYRDYYANYADTESDSEKAAK
jgi:capsular exopolysaccharide synthesis family protein